MIKIDRYLLTTALDALVKFVPKKSSLPVLTHIHVSVSDYKLVLLATQLDDYTKVEVPLVSAQPVPEFTVPAKEFLAVVKAAKGPYITIEPEITYLTTGKSVITGVVVDQLPIHNQWTLPTIDAEEWPPSPQMMSVSNALSFDAENLAWMIKSAARAACTDDGRPVLTALNMRISGDENTMNMVAADGFRLMIVGEWPETVENSSILSVPARRISTMASIFERSDWVRLYWGSDREDGIVTHVMLNFCLRNTEIVVDYTMVAILADIPAYNQLIPVSRSPHGFIARVGDLRSVINACKTAYSKKSGLIQVAITPDEVRMMAESYPICAGPFSVGATQIKLPEICTSDGVEYSIPLVFAFNADFLLDAIAPYNEENQVSIHVRDHTSPFEVVGNHHIYSLIMPMAINHSGSALVDEKLLPLEDQRRALEWLSELEEKAKAKATQARLEKTLDEIDTWADGIRTKGIHPGETYHYPLVYYHSEYEFLKLVVGEWNIRNIDGLFIRIEEVQRSQELIISGWELILETVAR